jgi:AraC-like DNA-binding protein
MSLRGFHLAFQEHLGQSPGSVLRTLRLEKAKELLALSDLSTIEIAQRCGYRSLNTFHAAFRNAVGLPPGRFRALFRTRIPFRLSVRGVLNRRKQIATSEAQGKGKPKGGNFPIELSG